MLYIIVVIAANALMIGLRLLFSDASPLWAVLSPLLATAAVFAWDALQAWAIRWLPLPARWFAPESRLFAVSAREKKFNRRLKVPRWQRFVPELGGFTGFHKDKLQSTKDAAYLGRFVTECNYGAAIHLANAVLGFAILPIPLWPAWSVGLPVALVNAVLSILPFFILRYNTAPLLRLYASARKREREI